jgi:hypothetical protein
VDEHARDCGQAPGRDTDGDQVRSVQAIGALKTGAANMQTITNMNVSAPALRVVDTQLQAERFQHGLRPRNGRYQREEHQHARRGIRAGTITETSPC